MSQNKIGLLGCTAVVAGNMMGSGIALLPANLATLGSITSISWILASIGAIALAFVFAKLATTNPQQGGPVAYAGEIAPILGYQTSVLYFNANWIGNLAIAVTGVSYCALFFPILEQPIAAGITTLAIIWIFTVINFFGAKWVSRFVMVTVALLLIPIIYTSIFGWFSFKTSIFISNWNSSHKNDWHTIFNGTLLCIWSFIGIESASVDASLVKNSKKTIPKATMLGVAIAAIVYFLSCTVISGIFSNAVIAESKAPFSLVIGKLIGNWASPIVSFIVALGCLVSLSSWMMLLAEVGVRTAKNGALPKIFAKKNAKGVPVAGLILIACMMSLLMIALMFKTTSSNQVFQEIITIAVLMTILPYFYSALNLIDKAEHPTKTVAVLVATFFAMLFCFAAYIGSQHYALLGVMIISLVCFISYVTKDRSKFEKQLDLKRLKL